MLRNLLFAFASCFVAQVATAQQPNIADLEKQRCPKPTEFAIVFSMGYAGDLLPKDDRQFEKLLQKIKDAGFNTVHCTYTPTRLELCQKHGIKMMIDLLAVEQHHVYKSADKAKAVCEKLRKHPAVWGYNIWNDVYRKTGPGRRRDVNTVRQWDPTHPAFSGTYRNDGMRHLVNADVFGYYDFHWKRKREAHFPHLLQFRNWAIERNAYFYRWIEVDAGLPGKGNVNRCLYSANTSIACGVKGIMWFLGTSMINLNTLEWTPTGKDIAKVNLEIAPLRKVLMPLGNPIAVYSTPITRTMNNDPLSGGKKEMMPPGLEKNAIPADFWVQPLGGEFVLGRFKADDGREAAFLANHNAYVTQTVKLKVAGAGTVTKFDRKAGQWRPLNFAGGVVQFELAAGGGELIRLERKEK